MAYQVLIVEDDPMAQQLFTVFVQQSDRYELVQAISSADLADIYCENNEIDLILMDIRTSMHANGLDAAERIRRRFPHIRILIVTSMMEQSYLDRAKEIGVDGFWYKEIRREPFVELMDRTMAGESVFPDHAPAIPFGGSTSEDLTDREREVLRLLVTGASNRMIAERMYISERTVKAHIQNMLEKTGFENRTQLAVKAQELGVVTVDL